MKQMRFAFIVSIALVMAFTFGGCKDKKSSANETEAQTEVEEIEIPDEVADTSETQQQADEGNKLVLPAKIDLFQYSASTSEYQITKKNDARIWGWSRDGKVAYSLDSDGGSFVGYMPYGYFYIFDTVSDTMEYELTMDENRSRSGDLLSVEALYNFYWTDISNALKNHGIVTGLKCDFLRFPINRNNMEYDCQITNISHGDHDYGFFDNRFISNYYVVVAANDKRKVIGNYASSGRDPGAVYVCGYFLSPFEERALAVIAEESYNFEGESSLTYRLNGCHLGVGFN